MSDSLPPVTRLGPAVLLSGPAVRDAARLVRLGLRDLRGRDGIAALPRWLHLLRQLEAASSDDDPQIADPGSEEVPGLDDLPSSASEVLISTEEAARMLNVSGRHVRNMAGSLGGRRAGRALVFDLSIVSAEAERRSAQAAS